MCMLSLFVSVTLLVIYHGPQKKCYIPRHIPWPTEFPVIWHQWLHASSHTMTHKVPGVLATMVTPLVTYHGPQSSWCSGHNGYTPHHIPWPRVPGVLATMVTPFVTYHGPEFPVCWPQWLHPLSHTMAQSSRCAGQNVYTLVTYHGPQSSWCSGHNG